MATEANKKKNLIIGACAGVAAIIAIVLVVVFVVNRKPALNDDYFKSDGSKYVINMITGSEDSDDYTPLKTHIVYEYSGDSITGLKSYYEYKTEDLAKLSYEAYKAVGESDDSSFKSVEQDGKFVIITAKEDDYKSLTTEQIKQQVELYEKYSNGNYEEEETEDTTEEPTEESTEETVEE